MANLAAPPPARTRPLVVTIAVGLLCLSAVSQIVGAALALAFLGKTREAYNQVLADTTDGDSITSVSVAVSGGVAVIGALIALGLLILALLCAKGKNPARVVTWVLGGLLLCCSGGGTVLSLASGGTAKGTSSGSKIDTEALANALKDRLPKWYTPVSTGLSLVMALSLLAVLILLALPDANAFFRKPEAPWEPPLPLTPMQPMGMPVPQAPMQPMGMQQPMVPPAGPAGAQPPISGQPQQPDPSWPDGGQPPADPYRPPTDPGQGPGL